MSVTELNETNFEQEVVNCTIPVVVDFWATWCGPCRKLSPIIEELAQEYEGKIKFAKLNTDTYMEIAKTYSISGLPTLLLFQKGESKERLAGMLSKSSIMSNIEKYIDIN